MTARFLAREALALAAVAGCAWVFLHAIGGI